MKLENILNPVKKFIKKNWTRAVGTAAITLGSLLMTACPPRPLYSNPGTPNATGGSTLVLTEEETGAISRVTDNEIYFTSPVSYEMGDIIVADITDSTPDGFLRQVNNISRDRKTVYTEQASLEDAIEDADFEFYAFLSPNGARTFSGRESRDLEGEINLIDFDFDVDVNDIPIFVAGGSSPINVTADAHADFGLKVILGGKIEDYTLKRFEFKTVAKESSDLTITADASISLLDLEKVIKEFSLPSFTIGYIPTPVGIPIPVPVHPKVDIVVGANGYVAAGLTAGVSQEASLSVGVLYENNQWTPIREFEKSMDFNIPTLSRELEVEAYVGAKLRMPLYGIAGPYGELLGSLKLKVNSNAPYYTLNWGLYGGLEARLGVNIKLIGKTLVDFYTTILDEEWLLKSGQGPSEGDEEPNTMPFAQFSVTPTSGTTDTEFNFNASFSSDNQDTLNDLLFRWDWEGDYIFDTDYSPNPLASHKYPSTGEYDVELQVKDKGGLVGSVVKFRVVDVTEPESGWDTMTDPRDGQVYDIVRIGNQWWMAENLNVGVMVIQGNGSNRQYDNGIIEKTCYNNDPASCNVYGGLYDWDEMMQYSPSDNGVIGTTQGIAPPGWHIPTDEEWKTLEKYLGIASSELNSYGLRGSDEGGKLKEAGTLHWDYPNEGATDESGFTALPGGEADYQRGDYSTGLFERLGEEAEFGTATEYPLSGFVWVRTLGSSFDRVGRYYMQKFRSLSVRCVKD